MQPRLKEQPDSAEVNAAWRINDLADGLLDLCYYAEARGIPPATVRTVHKCYRVLKNTVIYYRGEDHELFWSPPDGKFQKKPKPVVVKEK